MIDLMSIARIEADGGDLFGALQALYKPTEVRPNGFPKAVVWSGGNFVDNVNPVAHSLTDAYALLGTVAAIDILGLRAIYFHFFSYLFISFHFSLDTTAREARCYC